MKNLFYKLFLIAVCITVGFSLIACDSEQEIQEEVSVEKYPVKITVDFIPNLIFSKYDVDFSIDGKKYGTIEHGTDSEFEITLEEGDHAVVFSKHGSASVNGKSSLYVYDDTEVAYKISCKSDKVDVSETDLKTASQKEITDAVLPNEELKEKKEYDPDKINETVDDNTAENDNTDISPVIIYTDSDTDSDLYSVIFKVDFTANLIFSRYDVKLKIDGNEFDTLKHGHDAEYVLMLSQGEHEVLFCEDGDESVNGKGTIEVSGEKEVSCSIRCNSGRVNLYNKIGFKEEIITTIATEAEIEEEVITEESDEITTDETGQEETQKKTAAYYTSNPEETYKNGDSGKYAYMSNGHNYDIYYIIDFDEGYVYNFLEGDGNEFCDRLKIESGTLNDVVIVTYHDGDMSWSNGIHFKTRRFPNRLIVEDNYHQEMEFDTTDLEKALQLRDTKTITDW